MKKLFLLLAIFSCFSASSFNQFGLVLDESELKDGALSEKAYGLRGFLHNLEEKLDPAIRFGTNQLITVRFSKESQRQELDCQSNPLKRNLVEISIEKENQIILHLDQSLRESVFSYKLYDQNDHGCFAYKALTQEIEAKLLELPFVDKMDRKLTNQEATDLNWCESRKKRKGLMAFRGNSKMKRRCGELFELREKRRKFERYEYKLGNLLYKTKMQFDPTAQTDQDLRKYNICKRDYKPTKVLRSGKKIKVLGMAIVYMAPGYTTSVMGHMAERYIYCLDNKLMDVLFEFTQMTEGEIPSLRSAYREHYDKANPDYVNGLKKKLYMKYKTNPNTNQIGAYGFYNLYSNRDIIEVWPVVTDKEIYSGLQTNLKEWKKQKERFLKGEEWPEYDLFNNNCTHPVREKLNNFVGDYDINNWEGLTPINIFGFLRKKKAEKIIIYPSQRLLRQLEMLKKGKNLFWENTTFWSKSSEGYDGRGHYSTMVIYPETHGFLKKLILMPTYGSINLAAATLQTLYGVVTTPLKWLSNIPGLHFLKPKNPHKDPIKNGTKGIGMSLSEIIGVRMRFPKPQAWTQEEEDMIFKQLPYQEPKILDHLLYKVQQ